MGSKAIYFAYRVLQTLLFPVLLLYFLTRALRNRRYWNTAKQRLGFLPPEYQQTEAGPIWFHAVSVGEVLAIIPLIRRVRSKLPQVPLFVSTTTLAGYDAACEKLSATKKARVFFVPIDYVSAVRRVLRRIRPSVVVIIETEIWPNLFRESRRAGAALLVVNGRISDRAAPKYERWCWVFSAALQEANLVLAQSETMRMRFVKAGAPLSRVMVSGNLKYDLEPTPVSADSPVAQFLAGAKVWVAASTSSDGELDEEDAVIEAFRKLNGWKLILAPRKPDRFDAVGSKLDKAALRWVRRTKLQETTKGDVLLLDTVGELAGLFSLADSVFVGGSLACMGGHNVLEPAWFGKSITVGPHMENFREIALEFRQAQAFREIQSAADLAPYVDYEMGERAKACAQRNAGASEIAADLIEQFHWSAEPRRIRPLPSELLLGRLAKLWRWGGERKRAKALKMRQSLNSPVISIGNITVGGTGKTPVVQHLGEWLNRNGYHPGVLTRGYGRASPHNMLICERGGTAPRSGTGDEAQILLRSGLVALGVGANRAQVGKQLEERGLADIFLLDDGFQHARLARDFDLVLIDALAPFGGYELVPKGRLREPLVELRRASAFLLTRVQAAASTASIEARLQALNPGAPIFRSRVVPIEWVALDGKDRFAPAELPFARAVAFCGLGNPNSFWKTLEALGIAPSQCLAYGDHHRYTPREVRRLGQIVRDSKAEALLTTEKDAMNLCESTAEAIRPVRLFSLKIGITIEREEELFRLIEEKIRRN